MNLGLNARMVAGLCWPWSDPDADGNLVNDVRVGDWSMPWNAKADAARLGPGIPKSDFWASAREEIDQVGCVYTAQGFEFDYVGIIFGPDLVYRPMDGDGSASATSPATASSAEASPTRNSPPSSRAPIACSSPAASAAATCILRMPPRATSSLAASSVRLDSPRERLRLHLPTAD